MESAVLQKLRGREKNKNEEKRVVCQKVNQQQQRDVATKNMGTQLNRIVENKTNGDIQSTLTFLVNTEAY